jgi:hypothetical protein
MSFATKYIVFGNIGSDAGYYVWDGHGWKHVGGWGVEQMLEVSSALKIMGEAARFKTPDLANSVTQSVSEFVQRELSAHLPGEKGGNQVVVIVAG